MGQDLLARLVADDRLEVSDELGIRRGADRRADHIVGRADVGDPIADGLAGRVLERAAAGVDGQHLGPQHPHAHDVEPLAFHVDATHVDVALKTQQRGGRRGRDPVLAGSGLGDDALLAHAFGEQHLRQCIVDFVGARVAQVFALEIEPLNAVCGPESLGQIQRRRATDERRQQAVQLLPKCRVLAVLLKRHRQLVQRADHGLGHVPPAVRTESRRKLTHATSAMSWTAWMNAATRTRSL